MVAISSHVTISISHPETNPQQKKTACTERDLERVQAGGFQQLQDYLAGGAAGVESAAALSALAAAFAAALSALAVALSAPLSALAAGAAAGAPSSGLPFTTRPACYSLTALFSPMPFTRFSKSGQSLKSPFLRSSRMAFDLTGPMPLTASSAAASALLTSTCAKAKPMVTIRVATASKIFLNMSQSP